MPRSDGKSRPAEMRRNDTNRNPAGTGADRFQNSDASGTSSSRGRSSKSGAERRTSKSAGRNSGGGPTGSSSNTEATE